jgi:glycosyltransferase involved in cell wall biosynthesis
VNVRVAIAHEWLVRYAGSEQCVSEMLRMFPEARLLTTVVNADAMPPEFARAESSFLQKIPGATTNHEWLLPLMPAAWRFHHVRDVDIVISSSHACANAVRVAEGVPLLSYCHTPMRYAWDFESEARRFPGPVRPAARALMSGFRSWDRKTAQRVTRFVANSSAVARRIERCYGRHASVVHPPVRTEFFTPGGERGDGFLYVGRLVGYKRPELAVEAFRGLPYRLVVVGEGGEGSELQERAPANVTFLGSVGDDELRGLYREARAMIAPGVEDFGIAMAEAQACGTPVIAANEGGATDIVVDGMTGWLVDHGDVSGFRAAVARAAREDLDHDLITANARRFSRERYRDELRREIEETLRGRAREPHTRMAAA